MERCSPQAVVEHGDVAVSRLSSIFTARALPRDRNRRSPSGSMVRHRSVLPLIPVGLSGQLHFDWGRGTWSQGGSSKSRNSSSEPGAHAHGGFAAKRVRGRRGGPICRKSCFHATRWPGSGPTAVGVALGPCAMPSRPPSAKPLWWACIRSSAALAAPGFGSSALLSPWGPGPRSPVFMTLCNAACARGCRLIGLFTRLASTQDRMGLPWLDGGSRSPLKPKASLQAPSLNCGLRPELKDELVSQQFITNIYIKIFAIRKKFLSGT